MNPDGQKSGKPGLLWLFFGFDGRIGRQSFALGFIFLFFPILFVVIQTVKAEGNEALLTLWGMMFLLLTGLLIWPVAALTVKRVHDLGWHGFLAVIIFIPGFQWLFLASLLVLPSSRLTNRHGLPPFSRSASHADSDPGNDVNSGNGTGSKFGRQD